MIQIHIYINKGMMISFIDLLLRPHLHLFNDFLKISEIFSKVKPLTLIAAKQVNGNIRRLVCTMLQMI